MSRLRAPLIVALVSATLLLLAFAGTTAVSFPLWFRYRGATGLSLLRTIALVAAGLAAVSFFVAAAILAVAAALRPAGRWRKLLYILPAYFLGFTLTGALLFALRIGTTGGFTTIWIGLGALLTIVATIVAALRMSLGARVARGALRALAASGALGTLAWLCMVASAAIVLTSTPSAAAGGFGNGQRDQSAPTAAAGAPSGQGQPGFQPGPEGGPEFGPGGRQASATPLLIGVALMALFAGIQLTSVTRGLRAAGAAPSDTEAQPPREAYRHETGRAIYSSIALTIVGLAVAQLIPISRDNPPAHTAVKWDSPQTQALAGRACLDCHSNETRWPWYGYIAPGSWLLKNHVNGGREELNFSELNNLPAFRQARVVEDVGQQIRNGAMPPADYLILHPDARLSDAEKRQLIQGLQQSLAASLAK